jgi:hypothetical protein
LRLKPRLRLSWRAISIGIKFVTLDIVKKKVPKFIEQSLARVANLYSFEPEHHLEKIDESLTPNMRALRLAMTIAEQLLSMGVVARDVVRMAQGITRTYCRRPVHVDVSYTLVTISQDRGVSHEPLTMARVIVPDDPNYQLIQALQLLALDIRRKQLSLEEAAIIPAPKYCVCPSANVNRSGVAGKVMLNFVAMYNPTVTPAITPPVAITTFNNLALAVM